MYTKIYKISLVMGGLTPNPPCRATGWFVLLTVSNGHLAVKRKEAFAQYYICQEAVLLFNSNYLIPPFVPISFREFLRPSSISSITKGVAVFFPEFDN